MGHYGHNCILFVSMRHIDKMFNKIKQQPFNIKLKSSYKIYINLLNKMIKSDKDIFFPKK